MPQESDWRKFRDLVPVLRERYIAERNTKYREILEDSKKTETDRFWAVFGSMEVEARVLRSCLDGHSRSSMWMYLERMRRAGMLRKEDLAGFSTELQEQVFYERPSALK